MPIRRSCLNGLAYVLPGFEAVAVERQRPQHFPPRFDQVKVGSVVGLKDERPARRSQGKQQDLGGPTDVEVIQNGLDRLSLLRPPEVDALQKIYPIGNGPTGRGLRVGLPSGRAKGTKDVALPASAIIDFLTGTLGGRLLVGGRGSTHQLLPGEALGRFRAHVIRADHNTPYRGVRIECLNAPLFLANSGSTRSPNQVS